MQLAAQTLQSFFTGGSAAREHAEYRLDDVLLRAPVLEPPAVRLFDDASSLLVREPERDPLAAALSIIGARGTAGRRDPPCRGDRRRTARSAAGRGLPSGVRRSWLAPKDRDFALLLGPVVETELERRLRLGAARALASCNTRLRPGDLLGGPPLALHEDVASGRLELTIDGLGTLSSRTSLDSPLRAGSQLEPDGGSDPDRPVREGIAALAKALRLYDENGLLPPARVDPDSGYRFYRLEQLREATLIGLLRTAGMPLAQIRRVLDDPAPVRIDEYEAALADELAERRRILDYVRRFLKEEHMFEVKTKRVDAQPYESRSKQVPGRRSFEPFIHETIAALTAEHEAAGHAFAVVSR